MSILRGAIELAEPGGVIHPFVELGLPMSDLLKRLIQKNIAVDYLGQLLTAFSDDAQVAAPDAVEHPSTSPHLPRSLSPRPLVSPTPTPQPLVEPLTNRELEILELLAQRLQNKEIADKLFVSTETVKTHLNNIYQKLNVSNRREAVEKAKTLGIL